MIHSKKSLTLIEKVLRSGQLARGELVQKTERKIAQLMEVKHALLLSSATGGLHSGLLALGTQPGDEIITTAFTFSSPINMILAVGAKPVFVDIDQRFKIIFEEIEAKITPKTKGILVIDLFGMGNDWPSLRILADKYHLWLMADSSQSLGARHQGLLATASCEVVVGSFFDTKAVSSGEGGVLLTQNTAIHDQARVISSHGQAVGQRYEYVGVGYNYRPTEIQAALLLPQLDDFAEAIESRRRVAATYTQQLAMTPEIVEAAFEAGDTFTAYPLLVPPSVRDELSGFMELHQIEHKITYPKILPEYECFAYLAEKGELSLSQEISRRIITLPLPEEMSNLKITQTTDAIKGFLDEVHR